MTKKDRRKLRDFAKEERWLKMSEPAKRQFVRQFILEHKEYRKKDKQEVIFVLLGVRV